MKAIFLKTVERYREVRAAEFEKAGESDHDKAMESAIAEVEATRDTFDKFEALRQADLLRVRLALGIDTDDLINGVVEVSIKELVAYGFAEALRNHFEEEDIEMGSCIDCGADLGDGEGHDGYCGNCADRQEGGRGV